MKPTLIALGAIGRRFLAIAGTALLGYVSGHWVDWAKQALAQDPKTLLWIPAVVLFIEFIQKAVREWKKQP